MKFLEEKLSPPILELIENIQGQIVNNTTYFGIKTFKCPLDFWIYQEIITEIQPDVIIEIGNLFGGSALALAHILDNLNKDNSKVIAVDINHDILDEKTRNHKKIYPITGDALLCFEQVKSLVKPDDKVLIIEDSSHLYESTLEILKLYSSLVTLNSYFIVEDSILSNGLNIPGLPFILDNRVVLIPHNGGPYRAINDFISQNDNFIIDRNREKFILTWNPKGFLKKIK